MGAGYRVKLLKLTTGERFPLLLGEEGEPLFAPTVYALTELRARNQASNTISAVLRAIQVLYLFLGKQGIDLSLRLSSGQLLSLGEVEDLVRSTRLPVKHLEAMQADSIGNNDQRGVLSLEKVRMRLCTGELDEVDPAFAATRIRYIRNYLEWLVTDLQARRALDERVLETLNASLQRVVSALTARIPKGGSKAAIQLREGLSPEMVSELLRVVSPQSPDNPWKGEYSRHRNELIVHWLYYLGLRRGELLGIRVQDIDFRKGTVAIHRRADDAVDPRINQPQSKTKTREIPLGEGLKSLTYAYVMNQRSALQGARKHDFLFCADVTGQPVVADCE